MVVILSSDLTQTEFSRHSSAVGATVTLEKQTGLWAVVAGAGSLICSELDFLVSICSTNSASEQRLISRCFSDAKTFS